MDHAICLVGATLTQPKIDSLVAALADQGLTLTGSRWLNQAKALDLYLDLAPAEAQRLTALVRRALPSIDVAVLPIAGRAKALLVADMDSTLVVGETIVEMARAHEQAGVEAEVARLTDLAMRGRLDFTAALMDRLALLRGLPVAAVEEIGRTLKLMPGAEILCKTMAVQGARLVVVSGGFSAASAVLAQRLGLHNHVANQLVHVDGVLTGGLGLPLVDGAYKREVLLQECAGLGLRRDQALAIGDGANDSALVSAAGLGLAFYGKPVLQNVAAAAINHGDLTTALYFQGYAADQFAT